MPTLVADYASIPAAVFAPTTAVAGKQRHIRGMTVWTSFCEKLDLRLAPYECHDKAEPSPKVRSSGAWSGILPCCSRQHMGRGGGARGRRPDQTPKLADFVEHRDGGHASVCQLHARHCTPLLRLATNNAATRRFLFGRF